MRLNLQCEARPRDSGWMQRNAQAATRYTAARDRLFGDSPVPCRQVVSQLHDGIVEGTTGNNGHWHWLACANRMHQVRDDPDDPRIARDGDVNDVFRCKLASEVTHSAPLQRPSAVIPTGLLRPVDYLSRDDVQRRRDSSCAQSCSEFHGRLTTQRVRGAEGFYEDSHWGRNLNWLGLGATRQGAQQHDKCQQARCIHCRR